MIFIKAKILHIVLLTALISGAFFGFKLYQTEQPLTFTVKYQIFLPPGMKGSGIEERQVAYKEVVLPVAGTYRVSFTGNCTLYIQTAEGLTRNPERISVSNRALRIVILNQTTDVTVRLTPEGSLPSSPIILLLLGGVIGYAFGVFKFE
ncbi:hypothetical protein [Thermococcus waiotapuensis]|uniref:Uncharacterized protein n=1 Tax=Thermococcus waiotapuensis TaxID=90909 RepID=A0AAE4NU69_9EURY|nr:hypothetical protein [Thermococcus waiotapuensis]MDV3103189.1 hypothetical protein [Thermococcus waiotapuensis]